MRLHSHRCLLRWTGATCALTIALFSLYVICLGSLRSGREVIETYLVVGLLSVGTALVAVWVLARLPSLAVALVVTAASGFLVGYSWGLLTYGSGAEDGTVWRGYGGAIIGTTSAIVAWSLLRVTHGFLSRDSCPTEVPVRQA